MGNYSIKELEQLSGIKAHTIRIWEKRYRLIEPLRTSTNIRLYSDEDLKKIINVSLLNSNGIKISRIADMTVEQLNQKVLEISAAGNDAAVNIDQLVLAMVDMEEELFEKILNNFIIRFGFEKTVMQIIYPFLQKIGILWHTKNITPAHEHFISNLIRQKIIVAIDGLQVPSKTAKKIVLFLPEGEMHELGLLFYHFLARKKGYRTYYLGQNLPHEDLVNIVKTHRAEFLITSVISPMAISTDTYLKRLNTDFPSATILASGGQLQRYNGQKVGNVQTFLTADEMTRFL